MRAKQSWGHRRVYKVPQAGIFEVAEQYAAAVEKYPDLAGPDVSQNQAIKLATLLDASSFSAIPPCLKRQYWETHERVMALQILQRLPHDDQAFVMTWLDQPRIPPGDVLNILRHVTAISAEARQELFRLAQSEDRRDRSLALTTAVQLPPLPDPHLIMLRDVVEDLKVPQRRIRRCLREFPDDPWTDRLTAYLEAFQALADEGRAIQHLIRTTGRTPCNGES